MATLGTQCKGFSLPACPPRSLPYCGGLLAAYSVRGRGREETIVVALPCSLLFVAGLQFEFINPIFEFSKGMNELQLNDAEYALLIAINIFSAGKKPGALKSCSSESEGKESRVKEGHMLKRSNKWCIGSSDKWSVLLLLLRGIHYILNFLVPPPEEIRFPTAGKMYRKIGQYLSSSFRNCYFTVCLMYLASPV